MKTPIFTYLGYQVSRDGLSWWVDTNRFELMWLLADYLNAEGWEWKTVGYSNGAESGSMYNI